MENVYFSPKIDIFNKIIKISLGKLEEICTISPLLYNFWCWIHFWSPFCSITYRFWNKICHFCLKPEKCVTISQKLYVMGQNGLQKWTQQQKSTHKWISTLKKQEAYQNLLACVIVYRAGQFGINCPIYPKLARLCTIIN